MREKLVIMAMSRIPPMMGVLYGIILLMWGAWVLAPNNAPLSLSLHYELLRYIAPEWVWGTIAVTIGAALTYLSWTINVKYLRHAIAAAFYFWGWLAVSYAVSDWTHLGFVMALGMALVHLYAYANVSVRGNRGLITKYENYS